MLDLIFLSPLVLLIAVAVAIRFGLLRRPFRVPGGAILAGWAAIAFMLPLTQGVWLPDILFAPHRTLATAKSQGGYSFRVVQFWNRIDFYSTELHVTSPDNSTKVVTLDGDDKKSWSVSVAINEANQVATVTLGGGRTKDLQW